MYVDKQAVEKLVQADFGAIQYLWKLKTYIGQPDKLKVSPDGVHFD